MSRRKLKSSKHLRSKDFVSKNYKWIISTLLAVVAILVSIILVPWGVRLSRESQQAQEYTALRETKTFYFTPTLQIDTAKVKDDAFCWESNSSSRQDAYRCSWKSEIYDPCFKSSVGYVDCPSAPDANQVITVREFQRPRNVRKYKSNTPWYVLLQDNTACRYLTGLTDIVADARIDYLCEDERYLSLPIRENEVKTIKCSNRTIARIEMCNLKEVWY